MDSIEVIQWLEREFENIKFIIILLSVLKKVFSIGHRFNDFSIFERLANYDHIHYKSHQRDKLIRCLKNYLIDYQFPHLIWDEQSANRKIKTCLWFFLVIVMSQTGTFLHILSWGDDVYEKEWCRAILNIVNGLFMFSNIGDSNLKHIFGGLDNWHILSEDRNAICYTKQQFSQSFVMNLESLKKVLYLDFLCGKTE